MKQTSYHQAIKEWRKERNESIRKENGWLALSGLYWLKLGQNQLGSDPNAEIQLPARLPANIGYFDYDGNSVKLTANRGQDITVNQKPANFAILKPDISEDPSFISLQDVRLVIIQRENRFGVRVWDNQREERRSFPARTWYKIDEEFRISATFSNYDHPKTAYFPGLLGEKAESPVDGFLSFKFKEDQYQVDVNKQEDGSFFLRFWDPTSKDETYPTGRYLITHHDANGKIFLDFNKAYNPPCSFTDFATCVFAPEQNHLKFRVTAGEKYQRHEQ